jgi:hypothetical protein
MCNVAPEELADTFPFPTNASYSEVDFEGGEFVPVSFSRDEHLAEFVTRFGA